MTRDDINRLWAAAYVNGMLPFEQREKFARLIAAAEREACAKVCFDMAQRHSDIRSAALEMASEYIRARGNT